MLLTPRKLKLTENGFCRSLLEMLLAIKLQEIPYISEDQKVLYAFFWVIPRHQISFSLKVDWSPRN
jgi:hypothetical protein